jgi:manganese/iron transport system permease protein/iron/zinc/copper transport system permease protein
MQVLGVTMIAAAIVIPPIVARLMTDSFKNMILLSSALGAFCGFSGVYLSFFVDVSSGASVVLFSTMLFVLAITYNSFRSRLAGAWRRAARTPVVEGGSGTFD